MVDVAILRTLQTRALTMASRLGLVVNPLTDAELEVFGLSFERQLILQFPQREIVDIFKRHQTEILLGAMVAKQQMNSEIDGENPSSGKIGGPLVTRAGWLGIGDDWEDAGTWTTGSPQNWIHSGTTLMGGTAGNPVRIGENAVHVVVGVGSLHPSPKIESVQFTIDGKTKPAIITGFATKVSDLKVKELDVSQIWKKGTTVLGKVFISAAYGSSVTDYPYLLSVSFIKENILREYHDVANLPGTTADVILTT